jgi:hypothetical protein
MTEPEDRPIAEDDACPVDVEPGVDYTTPPDWNWRLIGTSQPARATYHVNHSDVTPALVDVLRPSDAPPDSRYAVSRDIPIIIMDSLDKYWASESRFQLPSSDDTLEGAKRVLLADLGGHFRLLSMLAASQRRIAPTLQADLEYLVSIIEPGPAMRSPKHE